MQSVQQIAQQQADLLTTLRESAVLLSTTGELDDNLATRLAGFDPADVMNLSVHASGGAQRLTQLMLSDDKIFMEGIREWMKTATRKATVKQDVTFTHTPVDALPLSELRRRINESPILDVTPSPVDDLI